MQIFVNFMTQIISFKARLRGFFCRITSHGVIIKNSHLTNQNFKRNILYNVQANFEH